MKEYPTDKFCHNPKCPNHISVDNLMKRLYVWNGTKSIDVTKHKYRSVAENRSGEKVYLTYWFCDWCSSAIEMYRNMSKMAVNKANELDYNEAKRTGKVK